MKEFSLLHEVSATLAQGLELREAVQPMFRKLTEASGLQRGLLTVINRETGELVVEECEDPATGREHTVLTKVGAGLLGLVAAMA